MKIIWYQSLLAGIAIVAVGCVGSHTNMSFEERLRADGYPADYVDGVKTGYESYCAKRGADKFLSMMPWDLEYCAGKNLTVKVEQEPKKSKSYEQGRVDGNILAGRHALDQDFQRRMQVQAAAYDMKFQAIMELGNASK